MCGIGGIINFNGKEVNSEELRIIADLMWERGPDAEGIYINGNIGLVHTRLSIVDLSTQGNQPMSLPENDITIVFNGEIYNFPELKLELQQQGVIFCSKTDTEVLLWGYKHWGIETLLQKIEGMFAFGIYDQKLKKVFLCRDRFGKKPIYFYHSGGRFIFSSDIKAVQKLSGSLTVNLNAIDYYLSMLCMPQPETIWNEIHQVAPATFLEINFELDKIIHHKYYQPSFKQSVDLEIPKVLDILEDELSKAILKRTLADVPVSCFLSGGVDSGLIVALLAQRSSSKVNTFSIGFANSELNELPEAKIVANKYGTCHTEITLEPDVLEILPKLIAYQGEPFADSSMIPSYYITNAVSKNFKVAISGDGGDELFGGYDDYLYMYEAQKLHEISSNKQFLKLFTLRSKLFSRIPLLSGAAHNYGSGFKLLNSESKSYLYTKMGFDEISKKNLYSAKGLQLTDNYGFNKLEHIWKENFNGDFSKAIQQASLESRLLNDYLVKVDRSSMMNSLEIRSPFLDTRLAEFAFSLKDDLKFSGFERKFLLKKLYAKHITADIFKRSKKGFSIPLAQWLRNDLKDFMKDHFNNSVLINSGLFNKEFIDNLLNSHLNNQQDHSHKLWALLCLELWFRQFNPHFKI